MTGDMHDWVLSGVSYRYPGGTLAVTDVSLELRAGSMTAIVGPNGAGKSTLLALLLGHVSPSAGRVLFAGREAASWPRRALAMRVGVLPQHEAIAFAITVRELVAMGRYPHLGLLAAEGDEEQRARLARAIAQEPSAYVLDEPSAGLDVAHEMALFEHARSLCASGATVVLVTHHVNLAARYADRMALLSDGVLVLAGTPAEVLTSARCSTVFRWPVDVHPHPGAGPDFGAPQLVPLALPGTTASASLHSIPT